MNKPDFERAKRFATCVRLQQEPELRLDPFKLRVDPHIMIDSIQNYAAITGIPVKELIPEQIEGSIKIWDRSKQLHIILYDRNQKPARLAWGIGHELGHIYLNHSDDSPIHEVEAHFFAAEFYAPEVALRYVKEKLGSVSEADIHFLFGLSDEASEKRFKYLYGTSQFYTTDAEKLLLERLKPLLDRYMENKRRFFSYIPDYFDVETRYAGLSRAEMVSRIAKRL